MLDDERHDLAELFGRRAELEENGGGVFVDVRGNVGPRRESVERTRA